ncbi:MAG TPA: type II secretion system F family protein, partial [Nitrospiria bacterium]|nr:type II secretion system F family protein [Nitrospiria bacterium]
MPTFRYKARDKYGALFTGTIDTAGRDEVAGQLDNLGYFPVLIEEVKEGIFSPDFFERFQVVHPQDMIVFSRQLATLISAGLPFIASFDALIEQTENKRLRKVITHVR